MEIYSQKLKILTEHADFNRNLRLRELLKFAQEMSIAHTTLMGAGRDKTLDKGLLWIVSKQHFEISRLPDYDEWIEMLSWAGETRFVLLPRFYEFNTLAGETLIRGSAIWGLIDEKTRTIIKPVEHGIIIKPENTGRELAIPLGFRPPVLSERAEIEVKYSGADLNGHLNNTAYLDLVMDLIPISFLSSHNPKTLDIQYKKEIKLGGKTSVSYGLVDDCWWFSAEEFLIKIQY